MAVYQDNTGDETNPKHETVGADATYDDHLIATTDNSATPGEIVPNQDPNVPIVSDKLENVEGIEVTD